MDDWNRSAFDNPDPNTWIGRIKIWVKSKLKSAFDIFIAILIPFIQLCFFLGVVVVISAIINIYLRRAMVPKALIHERVFFNHVSDEPTSVIRLHSALKQWDYVRDDIIADSYGRRFLKFGNAYDIHCTFTLSKSLRNYEIGATPVTLKMVDTTGETVAKSIRALIIPYQHPMSLLLESVFYFPCRALGYMNRAETVDVRVNLMVNYKEPTASMPPTESLELTLTAPILDISEVYITVMPKLWGFV